MQFGMGRGALLWMSKPGDLPSGHSCIVLRGEDPIVLFNLSSHTCVRVLFIVHGEPIRGRVGFFV
jgi:hypothetical protein